MTALRNSLAQPRQLELNALMVRGKRGHILLIMLSESTASMMDILNVVNEHAVHILKVLVDHHSVHN